MSDHNERPCQQCGSLAHHEEDCALRRADLLDRIKALELALKLAGEALKKVSKWLVKNTDIIEENPLLDDVVLPALTAIKARGITLCLLFLLLLTSCRSPIPGLDQYENNHKTIQTWPAPPPPPSPPTPHDPPPQTH